ncbi:MAG: acyl-CoA dehydrogenase family protein [Pseudomonadales bacterium]
MNFDFSDDQKLLREQTARFLTERCGSDVVRSVVEGQAPYADAVWKGLADMGLMGTGISEQHGGFGAGYLELCLVAQELGAALAPVPFGSTVYLVAEALLRSGSDAQKSAWLPRIAAGEVKGALAVVENLEQISPDTVATQFVDGTLTGTKLVVPDGGLADVLVVLARDGGRCGLYLVDATASGIDRENVASVDPSRNTARITFSATPAEVLGEPGEGWKHLERVYDTAAVLLAFEQLGGAQRALDMAVAYAKERFAFGRAIGSFQAIKHMLADMYVAAKLAESNCYYAAWALSTDSADLPLAAATARVAATQAFQQCSKDNVQVHGGMGFTWEFDCHLYYRRSNFLALELGGLSVWEGRLVDGLNPAGHGSAAAASA